MLRRILLASAGAMALSAAAQAAEPLPPPPPPPPIFSWTGLEIGLQIGYKWGNDHSRFDGVATDVTGDDQGAFSIPINTKPSGAIGGAHIGYNWQVNQLVFGVESNIDFTSFNAENRFFGRESNNPGEDDQGFMRNRIRSTIEGTFRGRLGWAWNNWLFYGTGGVAFADIMTQHSTGIGFGPFPFATGTDFPDLDGLFDSRTTTRVGWTAGGGIEWAYTPNWILGVEYRYSDFGHFTEEGLFNFDHSQSAGETVSVSARHHVTQNLVQARISYKFDWLAPVVAKY